MTITTVVVEEELFDSTANATVAYMQVSNTAMIVPNGSALTVTTATSSGTAVQLACGTHGLATGDSVYVANVGGTTEANGTWQVTVVTATTIVLQGSVFANAWTSGGTVQPIVNVAPRTLRYPTSGTFSGTATLTLIPTTQARSVPSGSAAGYTYLVQYFMTDGTTFSERWNIPPSPTQTTISAVRVNSYVTPTSQVTQSQITQGSASQAGLDVLTWDGSEWASQTVNVALSTQTATTYTVVNSDRDHMLVFTSTATAVAVTLPQAGASSSFLSGWYAWFMNSSQTSTVTITPTSSTIDGSATFNLGPNHGVMVVSNGSNYFTIRGRERTPYAIYASTADATVANTASETTLIGTATAGSLTLPANFYRVGKSLILRASGYYSTRASPGTLNIKIKHGSTVLASTGAITPTGTTTNLFWELNAMITCRSVGGSGTVITNCSFRPNTTSTSANCWQMTSTAAVTVTTTNTQVIDFTAQWGTASAADTITCSNFAVFPLGDPI